ncbi:MAG: type II toxin-antitoxin system VapB family antitoxin [Longimicrobiales bacterium]
MTIRKSRPKTSTTGASRRGERSKKTLLLDQRLLDRARRALGVRTETEAITQALQDVVRREQQIQGLRTLAALGPIDATRID